MYVITNENMNNDGLWEIGIKRSGFAYASPELAVLVQLAYERFEHFRIFEALGEMNHPIRSNGKFTLLRETYVPEFSTNQRIWFAIQCALAVCDDPVFVSWANAWIDGTDRSVEAAKTVREKLWADAIADAADAAAYYAAASAARAFGPAFYVAYADYYAAAHAAHATPSINFTDIAATALNFDLREFQEIDF
jgi:hypothetical protein